MDNAIEFKSLEELYNRIKPALYSKVKELYRKGKTYIKEEDIWNYLSSNVWQNKKDLTLFDMTTDILNLEDEKIDTYVFKHLKEQKRDIKNIEDDLL